MTEGQGRALTWIESNLWAIICAIATGGSGVLIGMTNATHRLDAQEVATAKLEARLNLLEPRFERLDAKIETERDMRRKGDE